jgi:hypothetical protein
MGPSSLSTFFSALTAWVERPAIVASFSATRQTFDDRPPRPAVLQQFGHGWQPGERHRELVLVVDFFT